MLNGLFPMRRRRSAPGWHWFSRCLSLVLLIPLPHLAVAQAPGKTTRQTKPAAPKSDADNNAAEGTKPAPEKKADDDDAEVSEQLGKIIPYEIFRDPNAEKLLGIDNYPQLNPKAVVAAA